MEPEISLEEVEVAEAAMREAKEVRGLSAEANRTYQAAAATFATARQRWRQQEVAGGRRSPGVAVGVDGGDQ